MKIMLQYLYGGGGGLANLIILYRAIANNPEVSSLYIVCSADSALNSLSDHQKVRIMEYKRFDSRILNRFSLGFGGLRKLVENVRPDIVVSVNIASYVPLPSPHLMAINNPYQVYPRAVIKYHPAGSVSALALRWFFRICLRHVDGIVVQTEIMKSYVTRLLKGATPVWVIGKSVEDSSDVMDQPLSRALKDPLELSRKKGYFRFLYVATAPAHKNHKILFRAMEIVRSNSLPFTVLLTISEDEARSLGGDLASSLIGSGHIIPMGWVSKPYLKAVYDAADACVMPSVLESLSSANLEAMSWGKPQIVSDLPYLRDLCQDAAVYVDPEDPSGWADAMVKLSMDSDLRSTLVANGKCVVQKMPATVSDAAAKLLQVFQTLASRKSSEN